MGRPFEHPSTAVLVLMMVYLSAVATAQSRMSDKDVENMMKNLSNDAKSFRAAFDHGTIRNTSQEKNAKALSKSLVDQAKQPLRQFQNSKRSTLRYRLSFRAQKKLKN